MLKQPLSSQIRNLTHSSNPELQSPTETYNRIGGADHSDQATIFYRSQKGRLLVTCTLGHLSFQPYIQLPFQLGRPELNCDVNEPGKSQAEGPVLKLTNGRSDPYFYLFFRFIEKMHMHENSSMYQLQESRPDTLIISANKSVTVIRTSKFKCMAKIVQNYSTKVHDRDARYYSTSYHLCP